MKSIDTLKEEALANHLGIKTNEITQSNRDGFLFEADGGEYMVLTDDEADQQVKENILETVWAFNKSFLDSHSEAIAEMDEDVFKKIQEMCEGANKTILRLIDDVDHFVKDAVLSDGRGHFLSSYDGEENEQKINDTWLYIYQIN
jgi:hypothetical protein